jgi:hypothetical protein
MSELCLRWAMQLPNHVPLTRYGDPLTRADARVLYLHWTRVGIIPVILGLRQVGDLLMDLSDVWDLPMLSPDYLVARGRLPSSRVRIALQRFETVGRRIMAGQGPS